MSISKERNIQHEPDYSTRPGIVLYMLRNSGEHCPHVHTAKETLVHYTCDMKVLTRIAKAGSSIVGTVVARRLLVVAGFVMLFFVGIPRIFQEDGSPVGPDTADAMAPSCSVSCGAACGVFSCVGGGEGGGEGCGSCGACACSCDGGSGDCCGGSSGDCGGGDSK